ncbi:MAG: amidase family protein [Ilumatobacteraceae bacterium]
MEQRVLHRRVVGWIRRRRRRRVRASRPRLRRRRLDPDPRSELRAGRPQAVAGTDLGRPPRRQQLARRVDRRRRDPNGSWRGGDARRPRRLRAGRPRHRTAAGRLFADEVGADPGRLRIGVLDQPPFSGYSADAQAAAGVRAVADALAGLGHDVADAWPAAIGEDEFRDHFLNVIAAYTAEDLAWIEKAAGRPLTDDDIEGGNHALAEIGRGLPVAVFLETEGWLHAWCRRVVEWWFGDDAYDLLLCPVLNGPPPRIGDLMDPETGTDALLALFQYTSQFNVTGQPAISLPLHTSTEGLPMGVQLVAAPAREDRLLQVAAQLESAMPWADRHPATAS